MESKEKNRISEIINEAVIEIKDMIEEGPTSLDDMIKRCKHIPSNVKEAMYLGSYLTMQHQELRK